MRHVTFGKSSTMNTMSAEQYENMGLKRTTLIPQKYHETDNESTIE